MNPSLAGSWQSFHMLVGEAAATLAGLVFVSASLRGGAMHLLRKTGRLQTVAWKSLGSLTLVLSTALCMQMPESEGFLAGCIIAIPCLMNIGYTLFQVADALKDRKGGSWKFILQRMLLGFVAYIATSAAAWPLLGGQAPHLRLLAVSQVTLLYVGITNAWYLLVAQDDGTTK